jgi:WD40 repeat protein
VAVLTRWSIRASALLVALQMTGCADSGISYVLLGPGAGGSAGTPGAGGSAGMPPLPHWSECGRLPAFSDPPESMALLGNETIAIVLRSGEVRLATGEAEFAPLGQPGVTFAGAAFSPDGQLLLDVSRSPWSFRSTATVGVVRELEPAATGCGRSFRFTPDSRQLLAFGTGNACVIDVDSGTLVTSLAQSFTTLGWRDGLIVAPSDSRNLVEIGKDGRVVANVTLALTSPGDVLGISPAGDRAVLQSKSGGYALYDAATGLLLASYLPGEGAANEPALFAEGGAFVLLGDRVVDSATGLVALESTPLPTGHRPVSLSNDGKRLGLIHVTRDGRGGSALVIDVETGAALRAVGGHARSVLAIAVSPDGEQVATSAGHETLGWRIAEPFERSQLTWASARQFFTRLRYSHDGSILAASGQARGLYGPTGISLLNPSTLPTEERSCVALGFAISPDGSWAAGPNGRSEVEVFDVTTGTLAATLPTSRCNVSASFSADSALLVTSAPELYSMHDFTRSWPTELVEEAVTGSSDDVTFAPGGREIIVSKCGVDAFGPSENDVTPAVIHCRNRQRYSVGGRAGAPLRGLDGSWFDFSADGDWLISSGTALQLSTGIFAHVADELTTSAFMPNGDVLAGTGDGSLVRLCLD